jgi:hypothetical protein
VSSDSARHKSILAAGTNKDLKCWIKVQEVHSRAIELSTECRGYRARARRRSLLTRSIISSFSASGLLTASRVITRTLVRATVKMFTCIALHNTRENSPKTHTTRQPMPQIVCTIFSTIAYLLRYLLCIYACRVILKLCRVTRSYGYSSARCLRQE